MWSWVQLFFDKHRIIPWTEMFVFETLFCMFLYLRKKRKVRKNDSN